MKLANRVANGKNEDIEAESRWSAFKNKVMSVL